MKAKEAAGQNAWIIECLDGNFEVNQGIFINSDILWDFFEGKIQDFQFDSRFSIINIYELV